MRLLSVAFKAALNDNAPDCSKATGGCGLCRTCQSPRVASIQSVAASRSFPGIARVA